jgi:hypothetical protein
MLRCLSRSPSRSWMIRISALSVLALVIMATGCETGSTHQNSTDTGVGGQNTGQSSDKSGPVPGSTTGTSSSSQ